MVEARRKKMIGKHIPLSNETSYKRTRMKNAIELNNVNTKIIIFQSQITQLLSILEINISNIYTRTCT